MQRPVGSYKFDIHSQNGEDGIVAEINRRLGANVDKDYWCVEFGAWDGVHLSNTFALVGAHSASAVYIEGDKEKFARLLETVEAYPSIIPVEALVRGVQIPQDSLVTRSFTGSFDRELLATLDQILASTPCPSDYDLLSIDIDSYDLEAWEAHIEYQPKIVIIEVNSSLPPGILQWHSSAVVGNSFSSTLAVAKRKGYTLVCHTGNMVFVRNDLIHLVGLDKIDAEFPERLFDPKWLPIQRESDNRAIRVFRRIARRFLGL